MNANVVSLLFENVKQHPGKVAVISKTEEITYSQLWQRIQGTLGFLESMGLQKGNKVAIYLADGIDFASCYYAILMGGGIVIPLASCLKQYEISAILRNCMPSLMITELDLWDKATSGQQFETHVIFIDQIASRIDLLLDRNVEPCRSDSVASINYTYNGTGYPKGAELTHGNYLSAFEGLVGHLGLRKEDVFLAPLPMAHIYSLALGNLVPMLSGATLVIADSYYPAALCKLVDNYRVTVMLSVPTLLYKFKEESTLRQLAYPSLRLMISGGEYMSAELCASLVDSVQDPCGPGIWIDRMHADHLQRSKRT